MAADRIQAEIIEIVQETPDVRYFKLKPEGPFEYFPGQWINFYTEVEGKLKATGFSMISAGNGETFELGVKLSGYPPTVAMYNAEVGDKVIVSGGHGKCHYTVGMAPHILLLAGGIGVTPMMSIYQAIAAEDSDVEVDLVYSCKTLKDTAFKKELEALRSERVRLHLYITQEENLPEGVHGGRVSKEELQALVRPETHAFSCGPKAMLEEMEATLSELGLPENAIHREKW